MKSPIYLDNAATTPVDPRVAEKMLRFLTSEGSFGNPASSHFYGKQAKEAVENARAQVASLLNAEPSEIIWTSGTTESNNLVLKGAAQLYQQKGKHIITLKTEHPSVLDCCQQLEKEGFSVTYLSPEKNGSIDLEKLRAAIRDDTFLVSVMHVNNETGVIQDISAIAKMTSERGILFHIDAAQSAGKLPIDVNQTPVDLISLTAHKIYGPKGIGALYIRKKPRARLAALIHGGGHEQGMRSGTLATHQIVGMGEAFYLAKNEMQQDHKKITELRKIFLEELSKHFNLIIHGENTIANIINFRIDGIPSQKWLNELPEIAISSGSACHSKGIEPSLVLRSMGLTRDQAECAVRFSLGRFTTKEEIQGALDAIKSHITY
jgi:cysteine desulfurase